MNERDYTVGTGIISVLWMRELGHKIVKKLPKVTSLVGNRASIQLQVCLTETRKLKCTQQLRVEDPAERQWPAPPTEG